MFLRATSVTVQYADFPETTHLRVLEFQWQYAQFQLTKPHIRAMVSIDQYAYFQQVKPHLRSGTMIVQYAIRELEPGPVSTEIFPDLPGLSFEVHMKPTFSTKVDVHTSGKETRTAYWDDPVWDFDLTYDYLPNNKAVGVTDLQKIVGFFLDRKGSFDNFLFYHREFNKSDNITVLTGDGNTVEATLDMIFNYARSPIGQFNPLGAEFFIDVAPEAHVVDSTHEFVLDYLNNPVNLVVKDDATPPNTLQLVTGAPAHGQYAFDPETATVTVNADLQGHTVSVAYTADLTTPAEYTISYPNTIVLSTAPSAGSVVRGTYSYYFVVRFLDDQADFDQFMDKLWELQAITLRSTL